MNKKEKLNLELLATEIRDDIITMIHDANSGHTGGSLSVTDILVSLYFGNILKESDKVVLSKGHAAPALYAILSKKDCFDISHLKTLRKVNSILQGHPDMNKTPGIDFSTGCLGQGPAVAAGMAYASKLEKNKNKVYVVMGDGELQEGSNWEAFSVISHNKLNNICVIVDYNGLQIDGEVAKINSIQPLEKRFQAFGFETKSIDGHDFKQIMKNLGYFKKERNKPLAIIAKTVKGKGVEIIENDYSYHGKPLTGEKYEVAKKDFEKKIVYLKEKLAKWN